MAAHAASKEFWTQAADPRADIALVLEDGTRFCVRRAMLELSESPVFDALGADEREIPVIGFTAEQVDCFLRYLHPKCVPNTTPGSILLVAPVAHFYGLDSIMQSFVQFLQEHADGLLQKNKEGTLDAAVLLELLRTRTEGSCPWSGELLQAMLLERVRTLKTCYSYELDPILWAKLKLETQMAMLEASMRGKIRDEMYETRGKQQRPLW